MTEAMEKIPFAVDITRVIEVLAAQIYQSPLALLRENTQNSFDAILQRRHLGDPFDPLIEITITPTEVRVADNGIGMSRADLRQHYWRAGSSSKNTAAARAAGVVGTFGIGAMANFGIAEELTVITESIESGERTRCEAKRSTLSATEDCILFIAEAPTGSPGTIVIAKVMPAKAIDVDQAKKYITEIINLAPIPILVNGALASERPADQAIAAPAAAWTYEATGAPIGTNSKGDVRLIGGANGEIWISVRNLLRGDHSLPGYIILRQGTTTLRTFRSGFGLAAANISSAYQFGGIADFQFLKPTAGREALSTDSLQSLQSLVTHIDNIVSEQFGSRPESDLSNSFMNWVVHRGRYDLCSHLKMRLEPSGTITLAEVKTRSQKRPMLAYAGADQRIIESHASEESPLLMFARNPPRRQCEAEFLKLYCRIESVSDRPKIIELVPEASWSLAQSALAFRVASILSTDYFLEARICFGKISHGLPILVDPSTKPATICLDPDGPTTRMILGLYLTEFMAFGSMAKDFVRNIIFPRVSDLVPSSTKQGAEAFLKAIQRTREVFEYETSDLDNLTSIWQEYAAGKLTMEEAAQRSSVVAVRNFQEINLSVSATVREVVPDVIENQAALQNAPESVSEPESEAAPPIERLDRSSGAKLLTIAEGDQALKGFRCFLALSDRVRDERGDFFRQPHKTSIVWGGQRALFVFEHHSGRFGLYYDVQLPELLSERSGGGAFPTCTIILKNRIFIPIPAQIQQSFMPHANERKRLELRCDLLYTDVDTP